jgi:DNA-binding response OmpR family regulator
MTLSTEVTTRSINVAGKTVCVLTEPELWSDELSSSLEDLGMRVAPCADLNKVFELAAAPPLSVLVLAQRNAAMGVRACRVIRELESTPLIVVMEREAELIPVLDAGADDAVVARVEPGVFAARVRALLRRASAVARSHGSIVIRELSIDLEKYQARLDGDALPLTPTEFRLLSVLAQHAGRVVDARVLLAAAH